MSNAGRRAAFRTGIFAQVDSKYPHEWDHLPMDQPAPQRRRIGKWGVVIIVLIALVPLYFFGYGAYDVYGYHTGKPATATATHCRTSRGSHRGNMLRALQAKSCTGTWTVDGQSHTGTIEAPRDGLPDHSAIQVHAVGGRAFAEGAANWRFLAGSIATVIIALAVLYIRWIGRSRRRYFQTET
jgi:hypothetical protein